MLNITKRGNYKSNCKVVKSGPLVEFYKFGNDIILGRRITRKKTDEVGASVKTPIDPVDVLKASARRAKRMIKRLIYTNCFAWQNDSGRPYQPLTLTLTFRDDVQNLKFANYEFTKFILRLNYEVNGIELRNLKESHLKYLAVFELQERGAIHYHCIFFNMPFINRVYDRLADIWENGMINVNGNNPGLKKIKTSKKIKRISEYFIKYIQKSILENKFPGKKKYNTSKGLIKPIESSYSEVVELVKNKMPEDSLVYKYSDEEDYCNNCSKNKYLKWMQYRQYNLADYSVINKEIIGILNDYS